jgi:hypothetical protein
VRDGEPVESLALIAPELHHACLPLSRRAAFVAARPLRYAVDGVRAPGERLPRYVRRALKGSSPREPGDLPPLLTRLEAIGREAFSAYRPGRYDGPATLFVPEARRPGSCDSVPVWRRVTGNRVRVERVPGGHLDAVSGENLRVLARRITERLGL